VISKFIERTIVGLGIGVMLVFSLVIPKPAQAVMPPDFFFNIGAQVVQFFSILVALFSVVFGTIFQFFRTRFILIKHKTLFGLGAIIFIVVISLILSYVYANYQQNVEYKKWLAASRTNNVVGQNNVNEAISYPDENNQLDIGTATAVVDTSSSKFVATNIDRADSSATFINNYYENIANGNYQTAYDMSKQTVDYKTFKDWYSATTKITLDKLVRIDETKSSLELTLFEGQQFTRYGVLMTLHFENGLPVRVEQSEVKILNEGAIQDNTNALVNAADISQEYLFYNDNQNANIILSNQEFQNSLNQAPDNYLVLDAREDIEFANGNFPASTHIRFADLKAGRWIELPKDKFVYVICWSGIRGKEVAEFLRTKKIVAAYLENGAKGWVDAG